MRTKVIGADLEGLLLAHQQPDLSGVIALQQPDLANAALLPLARIVIKAVQLALTAEGARLVLSSKAEMQLSQAVYIRLLIHLVVRLKYSGLSETRGLQQLSVSDGHGCKYAEEVRTSRQASPRLPRQRHAQPLPIVRLV